MNPWQATIKRVSKLNPGLSFNKILSLAKIEYRKMGHVSSKKDLSCKPSRRRTRRNKKSTRGIRKLRRSRKTTKSSKKH